MKKFNPSVLPYMGATVQAGLFAVAGYRYFNCGIGGALAGAGVGAVVNLSMATAASRISDIAKSRKLLAYLSLIALFLISPAVIVSSLGWSIATLSWSVSVDLSIMLTGSTFGKSIIAKDEPAKVSSNVSGTTETKKKRDKKVSVQPETEVSNPVIEVAQPLKPVAKKPVTDAQLVAFFTETPKATNADAARYFQVSHTAIGKRVKKLFGVKQEPVTKEQVK